jgi:hypothetical protein
MPSKHMSAKATLISALESVKEKKRTATNIKNITLWYFFIVSIIRLSGVIDFNLGIFGDS